MRAILVGFGAVEVRLRRGDIFFAVAVRALFVFSLGRGGCSAGFGDFFGTVTALGFLRSGARLLKRGAQFPVVEGDKHLAGLHAVAFTDENLVDASGNFRPDTRVAGFDSTGALQGGVAMEPTGGVDRCGDRGSD